MTAYTWELGLDWNALPNAFSRYLRHGLVRDQTDQAPAALTPLQVKVDDTVTFKIFDVTSGASGESVTYSIRSFVILVKQADLPVQTFGDPLSSLQLTFQQSPAPLPSTAFAVGSQTSFPAWVPASGPVMVQTPGRFLLSFLVQAGPVAGNTLIFAVDPEMIVGSNMDSIPPHGAGEAGASRTRSL